MSPKNNYDLDKSRAVVHFDIDCFACQVTLRLMPHLKNKPFATFTGGKLKTADSVNYKAKKFGVTRGMSPQQAIRMCKELVIVNRYEIGMDVYKNASDQLFNAVKAICKDVTIEKSSQDDFYIDLTEKCDQYMQQEYRYDGDFLKSLKVKVEGGKRTYLFADDSRIKGSKWTEAAVYATDVCDEILNKTGLACSAGISVNKALARIACKLNKPEGITLIESKAGIARVFETTPIQLVCGLGGKKGQQVKDVLGVKTLRQMRNFRRRYLIDTFGQKDGSFLWDICRGIDHEPVVHKIDFSSISYSFNFGKGLPANSRQILDVTRQKCEEFVEKLKKDLNANRRIAHKIRIEIIGPKGQTTSTILFLMSKSYDANDIYEKITAKGYPFISDRVPQVIKRVILTAFELKNLCPEVNNDPMFALTEQMNEMSL